MGSNPPEQTSLELQGQVSFKDVVDGVVDYGAYAAKQFTVGSVGMWEKEQIFGQMVSEDGSGYETVKLQSQGLSKYSREINEYETGKRFLDPALLTGRTLQAVPNAIVSSAVNLGGQVVGSVLGTGAALVAGELGPQAGIPEELISAPVFSAWGSRLVGTASTFAFAATQEMGSVYGELRDKGVSHKVAKSTALVTGGLSAMVETWGVERMTGQFKGAFIKKLRTQEGAQAVKGSMKLFFQSVKGGAKSFLGNTAAELTEEEAQALLSNVMATNLANAMEANPTLTKDKLLKQVTDTMSTTFEQSIGPSMLLPAGAKLAGAGTAKASSALGDFFAPDLGNIIDSAERSAAIQEAIRASEAEGQSMRSAGILLKGILKGDFPIEDASKFLIGQIQEGAQTKGPSIEDVAMVKSMTDEQVFDTLTGFGMQEAVGELAGIGVMSPSAVEVVVDEDGQEVFSLSATVNVTNDQPSGESPAVEQVSSPATDTRLASYRINQIWQELRPINGAIQQQESALKKAEAAGKATTAILNRLEQLYTNKENLEYEKILIEQAVTQDAIAEAMAIRDKKQSWGKDTTKKDAEIEALEQKASELRDKSGSDVVWQPQDVLAEGTKIQMTKGQLMATRMRSVKQIAKQVERAVALGAKTTRRNIQDLQTELISVIRSAPVSSNAKSKFLYAIRNANDPKTFSDVLNKTVSDLNALVEVEAKRELKAVIGRTLGKAKLTKAKIAKGRLTASTQQVLDSYKLLIKDTKTRNALLDKIAGVMTGPDATAQTLEEKFPYDAEFALVQAALRLEGYENWSSDQLSSLLEEIQEVLQFGRESAEMRRQAKAEMKQAIREQARAAIITSTPKNRKGKLAAKGQQVMDFWVQTTDTFENILNMISPADRQKGLLEGVDLHTAVRNELIGFNRAVDEFRRMAKEALSLGPTKFSDKELLKVLSQLGDEVDVGFTTAEGKFHKDTYSKGELLDIYMKTKMDTEKESMHLGNKFLFRGQTAQATLVADPDTGINVLRTMDDVLDTHLTPELKILGDVYVDFYSAYYDRINAEYRRVYGVNLPKIQNYSPSPKANYDSDTLNDPMADLRQMFSILPSSAKKRSPNDRKVKLVNPMTAMLQHVNKWEHWLAWKDSVETISTILDDGEIRDYVSTKYSPVVYKALQEHNKTFIAGRGSLNGKLFDSIDGLRGNFIRAKLAGKSIFQFANQFLTSFASLAYVDDPVSLIRAGAVIAKNPLGIVSEVFSSPVVQSRYYNQSRELMELMTSDPYSVVAGRGQLDEFFMMGLRVGDKSAVLFGGTLVYAANLQSGKSKEDSLIAMEKFIEETQQSGSLTQLSMLQKGPGNIFTLFLSGQAAMARLVVKSFVDYSNKRITLPKLAKDVFVLNVMIPILYQALLTGVPDEEKDYAEYARAAIAGNIVGVFMVGEFLNTAAGILINAGLSKGQSVPVFTPESLPFVKEYIVDPAEFVAKLIKFAANSETATVADLDKQNDAFVELIRAAGKAADTPTGLPLETLVNIFDGVYKSVQAEDPIAGAMAAGGFPRSRVEERLKKKDLTLDKLMGSEDQGPFSKVFDSLFGFLKDTTPEEDEAEIKAMEQEDVDSFAQKIKEEISQLEAEQPEEVPEDMSDVPFPDVSPPPVSAPAEIKYTQEIKDMEAEDDAELDRIIQMDSGEEAQ